MKVRIITYNKPHRKTQDLIWRLKMEGINDITLFALPWQERKPFTPLYHHRPGDAVKIRLEELCERMELKYVLCDYDGLLKALELDLIRTEYWDAVGKITHTLIAGAGVIPYSGEGVIYPHIINAHPGYLPNVRGLDALKWAILNGQPIGVTTHYVGAEPDTGICIKRHMIPLHASDTFHSIARRVYELEIEALVAALYIKPEGFELKAYAQYPVHRRMRPMDEIRMMRRLKRLIKGL